MKTYEEELDSEIRNMRCYINEPVARHSNPQYILSCLRVLGRGFSMRHLPSRYPHKEEGDYEVKLSQEYVDSLVEDAKKAYAATSEEKKKYFSHYEISKLKEEWFKAQDICRGLIQLLELQAKDEKKKFEEKVHTEEEIRSKYRNGY